MEEKARKIADLLKLLANEHRLLILCALIREPMSVGRIHEFTPGISASALSQHLSQLKAAGILESDKQGMNVVYSIRDENVVGLMDFLKARYCE